MTSYSTYGTGRIRLVDGDLTPDSDEQAAEDFMAIVNCLASGAARALLDTCYDVQDPEREHEIYAEEWHSENEGWELEALVDEDRSDFLLFVEKFIDECLPDILLLMTRLAWDDRCNSGQIWHHDQGLAFYRVGQLLGYERARTGIDFRDYRIFETIRQGVPIKHDDVTDRLSAWLDHQPYGWEGVWIDSEEEPCLLHLNG